MERKAGNACHAALLGWDGIKKRYEHQLFFCRNLGKLEKGDVVISKSPIHAKSLVCKRITALEGLFYYTVPYSYKFLCGNFCAFSGYAKFDVL